MIPPRSGSSFSADRLEQRTLFSVPAAASNLNVVAGSHAQVNVTWTDNSSDETGFKVLRSVDGGGTYSVLTTTAANATSYADPAVTVGYGYAYEVVATNASGDAAPTSVRAATVPLAGTVIGTAGSYQNSGNVAANAFDGSIATFFDSPSASGGWVGLDLGSPQVINALGYAPRTGWNTRMVGGQFQASNDPTFAAGVTTLLTVASAPTHNVFTRVVTPATGPFRYVRYLAATNSTYCDVAEVQFFGAPTATAPLPGTVIGTAGAYGNSSNTGANAFDGNADSYVDGPDASGDWDGLDLGLDLGGQYTITSLSYAPRSTYASRMVGGTFQGSNTADFSSGVTTLYTVAAAPAVGQLTHVQVTPAGPFRYVRYVGPSNGYDNVAELEFFGSAVPPDPASGLTATPVSMTSVALTWSDNSEAETGFKVLRSTDGGTTFSPVTTTAANAVGYTDAGLVAGTAYAYEVVATNAAGDADPSNVATVTTPTPVPAPTGLTAAATDDEDVQVTWTPAAAGAGTLYEVDRQNPDATWAVLSTVDDTLYGDVYADSGVSGARTYAYRVRAVGLTPDADSTYVGPTTATTPLTTPATPTDLAATESTSGTVDLTWAEGSPIVTGFLVTATPSGGGTPVTVTADPYSDAAAVADLTPGVAYSFAVVADNDQGNGHDARSAPSAAVTAVAPAATLSATAPATVAEGASFTLTLASSLPGGGPSPIVSWQVAWSDSAVVDSVTGSGGTDAHTPAAGAAGVAATVTATDSAGHAFTLPGTFVAVVPNAPDTLSGTAASGTEVDLSWTDHSAAAADDLVYALTDGGATFQPIGTATPVTAGSTNTYQATGLTPGVAYRFYVVADGGAAQSPPSSTVAIATPFETPAVSAQGTGAATEGGTYSLTLSAEYPDGEAGTVDHWLVDWGDGTGPQSCPANADPTQPTVVSHALGDAATVGVTATAVDLAHGSFAADPTRSYGLSVALTPLAPDSFTASPGTAADGTGQVTLAWVNTSAFATGTVVLMSSDGGATFAQQDEVAAGSAPTDTITGLTLSTAYQFELATDSANGWSAATAPVTRTTPAYTPPQLTVDARQLAEGQAYELALSATDPAGLPDADQIDHWTVDWGDPSAPGVQTVAGAAAVASHAYPAGTVGAHVVVDAVNAGGGVTVASDQNVRVAPAAAGGLSASYASDGTSVSLSWPGQTSIAGTTYAVQRQAPTDPTTGTPGQWATVGTVAATAADGQSYSYAYSDTGLTAANVGSLYRVTAVGPDSPYGSGPTGASSAATAAVLPSGQPSPYTGPGTVGSGYGTHPYSQPFTIHVSNLPAHMSYHVGIEFNSSDAGYYDTSGQPGDGFTLAGPGGRSTVYAGGGSMGVTAGMTVVDANGSRSADFTLTPTLPATYRGSAVTYSVSYSVEVHGGSVNVATAEMTAGGVYDIPVSDPVNAGNVDPSAAPVVLHVVSTDRSVLTAEGGSVTLDANGYGTLRVRALSSGSSPLVLRDDSGATGSYTQGVTTPAVHAGGGATVGGGAVAPAAGAGPSFTFDLHYPSVEAVTLSYSLGGSNADPSLYGGLNGQVTIPAGQASVTMPVTLDYGYQKVSADQTVVVTLPDMQGSNAATNDLYGYQRAELTIHDNATPDIKIAGADDGAQVPIDPQGDDDKLIPVTMSEKHWGKVTAATLTWDPDLDLVWLTRDVGTPGTDDLASMPGVVRSTSGDENLDTYTFPAKELPSDVYFQSLDGTPVDGMPAWDGLGAELARTDAVAETETEEADGAAATPSGLVLKFAGSLLKENDPPPWMVGDRVTLTAIWEGPGGEKPTGATYNWNLGGPVVDGFYVSDDHSHGAERSLTIDPTLNSVSFIWQYAATSGSHFPISCSMTSPVGSGSAKGAAVVFRPKIALDTPIQKAEPGFLRTVDGRLVSRQGLLGTAKSGDQGVKFIVKQFSTPAFLGQDQGSLQWVQVISATYRTNSAAAAPNPVTLTGLDKSYDYGDDPNLPPHSTSDSPHFRSSGSRFSEDFKAVMTLMYEASAGPHDWVAVKAVSWKWGFAFDGEKFTGYADVTPKGGVDTDLDPYWTALVEAPDNLD